jgi:lysozyme
MTTRQQIKRHEGLRLKPYADTVGKITIGYGHNLTDNGIPEDVAEDLLTTGLEIAAVDAEALLWGGDSKPEIYEVLGDARAAVLINMAFNLGRTRLATFRKLIIAVQTQDWEAAAREMLDSKWARQVPNRAAELAEQMRTGRWSKVT